MPSPFSVRSAAVGVNFKIFPWPSTICIIYSDVIHFIKKGAIVDFKAFEKREVYRNCPRWPSQESTPFTRKETKSYVTILELKDHVRKEVKKLLNIQRKNGMDWRGVASRMGVEPSTIEKIEKDFKEDPTQKLFEEISDKKIMQLVQVLCKMDRQDVLNILCEEMCDNKPSAHSISSLKPF